MVYKLSDLYYINNLFIIICNADNTSSQTQGLSSFIRNIDPSYALKFTACTDPASLSRGHMWFIIMLCDNFTIMLKAPPITTMCVIIDMVGIEVLARVPRCLPHCWEHAWQLNSSDVAPSGNYFLRDVSCDFRIRWVFNSILHSPQKKEKKYMYTDEGLTRNAGREPLYLAFSQPFKTLYWHLNPLLTHWGRDKMDAISQTTFSNAFSWIKMHEFRLRFRWSLFLGFELTIFQYWFR